MIRKDFVRDFGLGSNGGAMSVIGTLKLRLLRLLLLHQDTSDTPRAFLLLLRISKICLAYQR